MTRLNKCYAIRDEIIRMLQEKHGDHVGQDGFGSTKDGLFWFTISNWGCKTTRPFVKIGIDVNTLTVRGALLQHGASLPLHNLDIIISHIERRLQLPN